MAGERQNATLGDLGRVVTGKTPLTAAEENFGGQIPFVTPSDMDGRKIISATDRYLTEVGAASVRGSRIPAGSVMVSCIGSDMGKAAIAGRDCVTNQQINSIVVDNRFSSEFVYYNLSTRKNEIRHQAAGGSAQPILNKSDFSQLEIIIPPLAEQQCIASILGALDDKIELNRRMNAMLEAMARALFQSWFVDFLPVRAKQRARTQTGLPARSLPVHGTQTGAQAGGLDEATAALFPDTFQDSTIGHIPSGWEAAELGQIADVIDCLHAKKPERCEVGQLYLQLNNIRDGGVIDVADSYYVSPVDYLKWISRMEAIAGDCVITNVGRVGAVGQIPKGVKAALGRNITGIRCKADFPFPTFLIECLLSESVREEIRLKTDSGTILDALNVKSIPSLRLARPPREIAIRFEKLARPLRRRMEQNISQSRTLAILRDTLLPKLLSGELRVRDAESLLAESP